MPIPFVKILCFLLLSNLLLAQSSLDFLTPFEKDNNHSATYYETIAYYENLAKAYPNQLQIKAHGISDSGHPLHTVVVALDGDFDPISIRTQGKLVLFVNNAIHPGEPCGVDASMMLVRDCLQKKKLKKQLKNTVLVILPFYNIGGGLNRGSYSRANQNGPHEHGFRGNAKNLDLNRDFIKCDSRNAQTFNQIYNYWQPDIFIDNHTSNGADYQYTLTLIATQADKLDPNLTQYMETDLLPFLYKDMKKRHWEMTPYVYARNTPDDGIAAFLDLPRYSSGYAALHNAISFMPETHMLKPFKDRVYSVYEFMQSMLSAMYQQKTEIQAARKKAIHHTKTKTTFDLNWQLDIEQSSTTKFKGYEAKYKASEVSGLERLYYDQNKPYEKDIPYLNTYKTTLSIEKPMAYIIPQAYYKIIERLKWNGVQVKRLAENQELGLELYKIEDYKTRDYPYEGHYLHSEVKVSKSKQNWQYYKGDYVVFVDQAANRYIVETLEPQAPDAYFAWNFFDGILMQKEYFSAYVFEDLAKDFLAENPDVQAALEAKRQAEPDFAKNARAQLDFIYKHSPYYEPTHQVYPIGRLNDVKALKLSSE